MSLRSSFDNLTNELEGAKQSLSEALQVAEDGRADVALADFIQAGLLDLLGELELALDDAKRCKHAVTGPIDLSVACPRLAACNEHFNRVSSSFTNNLASPQRIAELHSMRAARGGTWPVWAEAVEGALERCRHPLERSQWRISECWEVIGEVTAVVLRPLPVAAADSSDALEYTRRLYDSVLDWYKNADSKAQILLTLDGVFLAFLTGSIFTKPDDLNQIRNHMTPGTWRLLILMCVALSGSIVSALFCLWSRMILPWQEQDNRKHVKNHLEDQEPYSPEVMWFFQMILWLNPSKFKSEIASVNKNREIEVRASQIGKLSKNVFWKHIGVDLGFILAGFSLIFFLLAGINYLVKYH